jgi:F-type H+-transporting ATPase subunit b
MQFDWFTFAAQLLNFALLIWLLQRFLFKPIANAMKQRETALADRYQQAEETMQKAQHEALIWREKHLQIEAQSAEMLSEAKSRAEAMRKQMVLEAREEVESMQDRWYAALQQEQLQFQETLHEQISGQVLAVSRRALADLAEVKLEHQIVEQFLHRLRTLDHEQKSALERAGAQNAQPIIVRSSFELPENQRQSLTNALASLLADTIHIDFETSADLLCGIEVQLYGHRLAWNLRYYIASLDDHLTEVFAADNTETFKQTIKQ